MRLCHGAGVSVTPRGSGTNLSGGSLSAGGVVVQTSRLNRIIEVDEENLTATVEPGVITSALHREVESRGLFYPPDPGSMNISTMGGNVAENSGGLRGLKYGVTADYVMGLETVLADGELLRTGGKVVKDVAGYSLNPLLVSSEGTLGFFTGITVKLIPKPQGKITMLAHFPVLQDAALAVSAIIAAKVIPATLEFLDKVTIKCVEDYAHVGLPLDVDAVLLIEVDGHPGGDCRGGRRGGGDLQQTPLFLLPDRAKMPTRRSSWPRPAVRRSPPWPDSSRPRSWRTPPCRAAVSPPC